MKDEQKDLKDNKKVTTYDSNKNEMYPLPDEEVVSYCEGKPCTFSHAERSIEKED